MFKIIKSVLQTLHIYHPLQSNYRGFLFWVKKMHLRQSYRKYTGAGFTCNCCGHQYRKFAPWYPEAENAASLEQYQVIAGYGKNCICPWCLSAARERLVVAQLKNEILTGKKILHLSPEKKVYEFIKIYAEVTTVDLHPGFYKSVDASVKKADATCLTYPDENFDWAIANHILEHIPQDHLALKEIFRVLKSGGRAILQVPFSTNLNATFEEPGINDPKRQSKLFGQKDHVRIYQLDDYIKRLKAAGFIVSYHSYEEMHNLYQFAIQQDEGFLYIKKPV